jgi:hypothetical protein
MPPIIIGTFLQAVETMSHHTPNDLCSLRNSAIMCAVPEVMDVWGYAAYGGTLCRPRGQWRIHRRHGIRNVRARLGI